MRQRVLVLFGLTLALAPSAGCGLLGFAASCEECDAGLPAKGPRDAGAALVDAGRQDAGAPDAGDVDSGAFDSGSDDGGELDDAGLDAGAGDPGADGGVLDGGVLDGGVLDGGVLDGGTDAGALDAGVVDAGPAWPLQLRYRKSITVPAGRVTGPPAGLPLVDFPLLVHVVDNRIDLHARSDGADLAFFDEAGAQLPHEIVQWRQTAGEILAWVKVPALVDDADTRFFLYYGGDPVDALAGEVWSEGYRAVWHLDEGASGPFVDSSPNANDCTPVSLASDAAATGRVRGAVRFDAVQGQYLDCGNDNSLDLPRPFTLSLWAQLTNASATHFARMVSRKREFNVADGYELELNPNPPSPTNPRVSAVGNGESYLTALFTPQAGTWVHIAVVFDNGADGKLFLDGTESAVYRALNYASAGSADLWIGNGNPGNWSFPGLLDEVRLFAGARSQAWLQAERDNQRDPDTFVVVGAEEER